MYCKNCGKEISEDSNFCPQCGKSLNAPDSAEDVERIDPKDSKEPNWFQCCISPILICVIIAIGIAVLLLGSLDCISRGYIPLFHEKADELDIILDADDVKNIFTDDVVYVQIRSNEKIKDLKIKFYLSDSDGNILKETLIEIGDIARGDSYSFTVNDVGLSTSEKHNITKYKYEVVDGYVFK